MRKELIAVGLLGLILFLFGCIETPVEPKCRDYEIFCSDMCILPVCESNLDCNDGSNLTKDDCLNPGTCEAGCNIVLIEELKTSFSYKQLEGERTMQFLDASRSDDIEWWLWEFGDGEFSGEQNPVHAYEEEGLYYVKLKVRDSKRRRASYSETIEVNP